MVGYSDPFLYYDGVLRGQDPINITNIQKAFVTISGPLVSSLIILFCCIFISIKKNQKWPIAVGLITPLRNLNSIKYFIFILIGTTFHTTHDEIQFANEINIPMVIPLLVSILIMVFAYLYLITRIRNKKIQSLLIILSGGFLGILCWFNVLGPILFP
jgi:hypothetical protein